MRLLILSLCFYLASCTEDDSNVSIVQLVADPAEFNNEDIFTTGYFVDRFENRAIYIAKEHADHVFIRSGIWMEINPATKFVLEDGGITECSDVCLKAIDQKYVMVGGKFSSSEKGHMGLFAGSIKVDLVSISKGH